MSQGVPAAVVAFAVLLAGCSRGRMAAAPNANGEPAAQVPTLVLTEARSGALAVAEAGDPVEVRLAEESGTADPWRLASQQGGVLTLVSEGVEAGRPGQGAGPYRVFRFSSRGAGRAELAFARRVRSASFVVELR